MRSHLLFDKTGYVTIMITVTYGERLLRTTIGNFLEGVQYINQTTEQLQAQIFEALGLGALLKATAPAA